MAEGVTGEEGSEDKLQDTIHLGTGAVNSTAAVENTTPFAEPDESCQAKT
ncbi:MAG: hypothetical protein L3J49_12400 [Desulfobulbaceae bacterium]|nr:hypothetical protein [Desulfobulbaceae bacterium]